MLNVRVMDSGKLMSDSRDDVITVTIDPAPKAVGTIGNMGVKEGVETARMTIEMIKEYFSDVTGVEPTGIDADDANAAAAALTALELTVSSSHPEIATVKGNPGNTSTFPVPETVGTGDDVTGGLIIQGKSEGEATITITATEPAPTPPNDPDQPTDGELATAAAALEQWATQTILVRVTRN